MGGQETKWGAEVVEDQFRDVAGAVSMAWELFAFDPVRDAEVEVRARWQVHDVKT